MINSECQERGGSERDDEQGAAPRGCFRCAVLVERLLDALVISRLVVDWREESSVGCRAVLRLDCAQAQ